MAARGSSIDDWITGRLAVEQLKDQQLVVDGFNLIITIEAALSGGPLLVGVDGCIRDLSSVHGSYRSVEETDRAITMIGSTLDKVAPASVHWLLDQPVSNSGRLAAKIADLASRAKLALDSGRSPQPRQHHRGFPGGRHHLRRLNLRPREKVDRS